MYCLTNIPLVQGSPVCIGWIELPERKGRCSWQGISLIIDGETALTTGNRRSP